MGVMSSSRNAKNTEAAGPLSAVPTKGKSWSAMVNNGPKYAGLTKADALRREKQKGTETEDDWTTQLTMESLLSWDAVQSSDAPIAQNSQSGAHHPPQPQEVQQRSGWNKKNSQPQAAPQAAPPSHPYIVKDPALGAGLEMTPTRWGMRVDKVAPSPGQPHLVPGDTIVAVGGVTLEGHPAAADVKASFGRGFANGALITVFSCITDTVALPASSVNWPPSFNHDLQMFSNNFSIGVRSTDNGIELRGPQTALTAANAELDKIIAFYKGTG